MQNRDTSIPTHHDCTFFQYNNEMIIEISFCGIKTFVVLLLHMSDLQTQDVMYFHSDMHSNVISGGGLVNT